MPVGVTEEAMKKKKQQNDFERLLDDVYENGRKRLCNIKQENPDLRVYLGASKNREEFYEKFGFIKRIDADLGYGMILNK